MGPHRSNVIAAGISLPGIDGQEATRRIRALKDPEKRDLPVIAMSAHVFKEEVSNYLATGMNAFLGKPFAPEQLSSVLQQVILDQSAESVVM